MRSHVTRRRWPVAVDGRALRVDLLGPLRVWGNRGEELVLGSPGPRSLFSLLALAVGRPLSVSELIASLWPVEPPAAAENIARTYVKRLRRVLEPDRSPRSPSALLPAVADGYVLRVPPPAVDVYRLRRQMARARVAQREGRYVRAAYLLDPVLRRRATPLVDLPGLAGHPAVVAVSEEVWAACGQYGDAMIAAGRPSRALGVLVEAAIARPLDELAQARLMKAYRAVGQRAQAFWTFDTTQRRLSDELGAEPGPELVAAYRELLD